MKALIEYIGHLGRKKAGDAYRDGPDVIYGDSRSDFMKGVLARDYI